MEQHRDLEAIDQVLRELDEIIDWSLREGSQHGFFAAMYRKVTAEVKNVIVSGSFEDGSRMSHLDKVFADRYLLAFRDHREGRPVPKAWQKAFDAASSSQPLILQHLLLGMNAHIVFDLGIAAATVASGTAYPSLKKDFDEINRILFENLDSTENKIGEFSPALAWLDRWVGGFDEMIGRFGMKSARNSAWRFGARLAALSEEDKNEAIRQRDKEVSQAAELIRSPPGLLFPFLIRLVRLREEKSAGPIIRALSGRD